MKINDAGNNLNGAIASDVQFQFAGNQAGKTNQNLLSSRKIGIRQNDVPVLEPPMEMSIGSKNQSFLDIITGVVQSPKALKTWYSPKCCIRSHYLLCIENHLFVIGIGPIRDKEI